MLTPLNFVVIDPTAPESQQWDTLALLLHERETHGVLLHSLFAAQQQGGHGPLWLAADGQVVAIFN